MKKIYLTISLTIISFNLFSQYDYNWIVSNTSSNPGERVVAVIDAGTIGTFTGIEIVGQVIDNYGNWGNSLPIVSEFSLFLRFSDTHQYRIVQSRELFNIKLQLRKISDTLFHLTANCPNSHKSVSVHFKKTIGSPSISLGSTTSVNSQGELVISTPEYMSFVSGKFAIGTNNPTRPLEVRSGQSGNVNSRLLRLAESSFTDRYDFSLETDDYLRLNNGANDSPIMAWSKWGSVGIGTTTTGTHKLAVEGSIGARKVKVEATGWSDFVFDNNYVLPNLQELELFISKHRHLPEIPSEKEVKENGIDLGEMDSKLLQKIEELTLYLIQQDKEIRILKSELEKLKEKGK